VQGKAVEAGAQRLVEPERCVHGVLSGLRFHSGPAGAAQATEVLMPLEPTSSRYHFAPRSLPRR
jgi:hypothetical protein